VCPLRRVSDHSGKANAISCDIAPVYLQFELIPVWPMPTRANGSLAAKSGGLT
jgi:hypothetical protein